MAVTLQLLFISCIFDHPHLGFCLCLDHSSAAFFFFFFLLVAEKKIQTEKGKRFVMTEENYECMFFSAVFLAICIFTNSLSITFLLILKLLFTTKLST